jgi:eukaryotic-like serine/threonine-protein kinase
MSGGDATVFLPQRIGRYRVINVLGSGAMGMVYLAHDEMIGRQVAIKTIHQHLLHGENSEEWLARFRREVRAAGRSLHPNIVTIFEYGEQNGVPYIVMEYVQGRDLYSHLKERKLMPLPNALAIMVQVLQALSYAHMAGVVHRDIKPGNIILLADGQVKVTDFGIAKVDAADGMTQVGMALGTPSYMSPEQCEGQEADLRSDLFSVGMVLFELLAGVRPFSRRVAGELLDESPRRVTQLNPELPVEFDALFDKALAKRPSDRFQDAHEFIAALEGLKSVALVINNQCLTTIRVAQDQVSKPLSSALPHWNPDLLEQAAKRLVVYLGPVAKVLVRNAALQANSPAELIQQLMAAIPNESDRLAFQRQMQAGQDGIFTGLANAKIAISASNSQMSGSLGSFDQAFLEAVRCDLAVYLGPIAKVLVKQAAINVRTKWDLYERLAEHIPNIVERAAFLKRGESAKRHFL